MDYNEKTRLSVILDEHPWLAEELPKLEPRLEKYNNPATRFLARRMTVQDASRFSGLSTDYLLRELEKVIAEHEKPSL